MTESHTHPAAPIPPDGHEHVFLGARHDRNARRTWAVVALTTVMMVVEVVAGIWFNSMALLADGIHMATHAGAMLVAAGAYAYARTRARDSRFTFGTGKVGDLAAFASAVALAATSVFIAIESVQRLFSPLPIAFDEAIVVATAGLAVNLVCAWLLHDGHDHHHDHGHHHHDHEDGHDHAHDHDHGREAHHHHDFNLKAAFAHVAADALVSVLAIVGLVAGRQFGWTFLDPVMGLVGAYVVGRWGLLLMRSTGAVLLDMQPSDKLAGAMRAVVEAEGARVTDLHVWRIGPGHNAAIVALSADAPRSPDHYRRRLQALATLSHVTVEVNAAGQAGGDRHRRAAE